MARVKYNPGNASGYIGANAPNRGIAQPGTHGSGPYLSARGIIGRRLDYCISVRTDIVTLASGGTPGRTYRITCRETNKYRYIVYPGTAMYYHSRNTTYHYDCNELQAFGLPFVASHYPPTARRSLAPPY